MSGFHSFTSEPELFSLSFHSPSLTHSTHWLWKEIPISSRRGLCCCVSPNSQCAHRLLDVCQHRVKNPREKGGIYFWQRFFWSCCYRRFNLRNDYLLNFLQLWHVFGRVLISNIFCCLSQDQKVYGDGTFQWKRSDCSREKKKSLMAINITKSEILLAYFSPFSQVHSRTSKSIFPFDPQKIELKENSQHSRSCSLRVSGIKQ